MRPPETHPLWGVNVLLLIRVLMMSAMIDCASGESPTLRRSRPAIICIGESQEQRDGGIATHICKSQLVASMWPAVQRQTPRERRFTRPGAGSELVSYRYKKAQ